MQSNDDPLIGQLVSGRYRVKQVLGAGGMGLVYRAEHEAIQKDVALKVLHLHFSRKADIVTRFRQEAISASRIKHPNVLEVFDFGQLEDGSFFLAMEFLDGCDLADDLKTRQKLDSRRTIAIAMQICRALSAAHQQGVVHRDMKPENVFLQRTADGEEIVKIVDFGIAQLRTNDELAEQEAPKRRLTKTGMIFGTPEYMAPEQAAGKKIDHRVDVYAVGVILFELFSGAVPFTGDSFLEVLNKHLSATPPKMSEFAPELNLSRELEAVIERALAKNPDDRHASMTNFSQALLNTPEGQAFGTVRLSAAPSPIGVPSTPYPGATTAAQFGNAHAVSSNPELASAETLGSLRASGAAAPGAAVAAHTAPSNTQLEGTRTAATAAPGSSALPVGLALGGLVLLGGLGLGAFFVLKNTSLASTTPEAEQPKDNAPTASASQQSVASAETEPDPPAPASASAATVAPTTRVALKIVTDPPGATLLKDGFQVCDATPCEISASVNEPLELEAKKGSYLGTARVLAQRDQAVQIKLKKPRPKPRAKPTVTADSGPRMCEVEVDGLKILRPCK